jgi:hypothetical protein
VARKKNTDWRKSKKAVSRVLLVANIETEDPGFASDYIRKAVAEFVKQLPLAGILSVEILKHAEAKKMFLGQIQRDEPIKPLFGDECPISYGLKD